MPQKVGFHLVEVAVDALQRLWIIQQDLKRTQQKGGDGGRGKEDDGGLSGTFRCLSSALMSSSAASSMSA